MTLLPPHPPMDFRQTLRAYVQALNDGDAAALSQSVSEDDDICVMLRGDLHIRGKAAILDCYRRLFAQTHKGYRASIVWSIQSLDTAIGVVVGRDGRRDFSQTVVFNQHAGGWHLVFIHHSKL